MAENPDSPPKAPKAPAPAPESERAPRRTWIAVAAGVVVVGLLSWRLFSAVEPAGPARGTSGYHPTEEMPAGLRAPQVNTRPRPPFVVSPALQRRLTAAREHLAASGNDDAAGAGGVADGGVGAEASTETAGDR